MGTMDLSVIRSGYWDKFVVGSNNDNHPGEGEAPPLRWGYTLANQFRYPSFPFIFDYALSYLFLEHIP